jgi:hypothetical protein
MVRAWAAEMEALGVSTTHPLVSVRQLNLDDRVKVAAGMHAGRIYAKETRPSGRSQIPIRELSDEADIVNGWLKRVRDVDEKYFKAVEFWSRIPDFEEMAKRLHWSKTAAMRYFDCAIAILQSHILDY